MFIIKRQDSIAIRVLKDLEGCTFIFTGYVKLVVSLTFGESPFHSYQHHHAKKKVNNTDVDTFTFYRVQPMGELLPYYVN